MINPGPGQKRITWDDDGSTTDISIHPSGQRLSDPAPHGWDGAPPDLGGQVFRRVGGMETYAFGPDVQRVTFASAGAAPRTGSVSNISQ